MTRTGRSRQCSGTSEALKKARGGAVEEGSVGGGTGMVCFGFKGGIGTSSRVITTPIGTYTVGSNDNVIQVSAN